MWSQAGNRCHEGKGGKGGKAASVARVNLSCEMLAVEKKNKETNPTPQNTTVDQLLYRIFLKALHQAQLQDMNSSVS